MTEDSQQKLHEARCQGAVGEIARSDNLRYFIRSLINFCGVQSPIQGDDMISLARATGVHTVGLELIGRLDTYDPTLWPRLITEQVSEWKESHE